MAPNFHTQVWNYNLAMLLQHVHIVNVIVCTHLGALQPVLKFVKNIQHFGRVSLYFLLDFGHIFNFLKTVQKGLKPRWKCLKIILKGLTFVFEPFLRS